MLLIILLFHFLLLGYTSGQNNGGNCQIDGIPVTYLLNFPIKDTDTSLNLLDATYSGKLSDIKCTANDENALSYFKVSADKTKFTIETTDKLADIDKNTPKRSDPVYIISMSCAMTCEAGTSTLVIQFIVSDTNNHAPVFLEKDYAYKVASPIMPLSDFTLYGSKIIVEDLDYSNKNMTFSIVPDDFVITTLIDEKEKYYTAQFTAKKIIQLTDETVTYTITATDSEATPAVRSTSQKITIQSDSSKSLDSPSFKNPSYSFDYSIDGTKVTLSPRDGSISLSTNKPESIDKGLKLTGEYKDNFTPKFNPKDKTITLTATPITSTASFIILTLSVETDAVATTSVVVYLPGESAPTFSSHVYTATYTVDNTVKLDKAIEITSSRGIPEVTLSGDFKDNFKINYNPSSKTYELTVSKKLSGSDLKSLTQLTLTLTATLAEETDESALIIKLPEHQLQFTSAIYDATYDTENDIVTVDKSEPIAFSTAVEDIEITASGTYNEYFSIAYDTADKTYKVSVKTPLPIEILPSLQEITLTLSAKDSYEFEAWAALKISIPEAPKFSGAYYQANYPKQGTGPFDFETELSFTNIADPRKVTISLDSYQENFEVVYNSRKWQIQIKKPLDDSTLEKLSQIVITLMAKDKGNVLSGYSVLVLELPKARPEFSDASYTAVYPKEGKGTVEFQKPLNFKNADEGDEISITLSSYSENFLVEKSSEKWQIKIQKPLDDSTLKTNKELIITMEASGDLFTKTGLSVLVLQLPENEPEPDAPEFSDVYYVADYPESGTGKINFEPEIKFSEITDVSDITIEVSDYTSNFAIEYDTSLKSWQIQINSPLEKSILESESSLILTLTAKEKGVEGSGKATLVLNLPSEAPIFSKPYYVATYQYEASGDPSVSLVDDISITNKADISQISIVAEDYSDNFEIKNDGKAWLVHVIAPLSDTVLKDKTDLVISIKATDKTNGMSSSSVIDLKLPVNTEDAPQFSKTIYTAKYSVSKGKGSVTLDDPLEIVNRENLDKITITTDNYIDNFKITYDTKSKKWVVTVNANLDDSILKSKSYIVMELTALDSTTKELGTATLVVTLPEVNIEEPPQFSSVFYQAEYILKTTVLDTDIKIINKKDADKVAITIDKGYEKYFDIILDKTTSIWHVNVVNSLPDWETKDKEDLVLTLTATDTVNNAVGKAALVLIFPTKTPILFSKALYFANYTVEDGKASMSMEDIVVTNRESSSNIILGAGDYNEHFTYIIGAKKNSWKIAIRVPFTEEELGDNTEFILTLLAEDLDDGSTGTTTFIINLPSKNVDDTNLKFSEVYYEGAYVETEGTPKVNLDKIIEITSKKSLDNLKLTMQSSDIDATNYFELKKTSGHYEIDVKVPLPASILQNEKSLVLTLEAELAGAKSYATLVINVPKIVDEDIIFSKVLYNGQYEVTDGKVTFSVEKIDVTTTATVTNVDVSISTDSKYAKYFKATYASKTVTVQLLEEIPDDILKTKPTIALELTIKSKDSSVSASAVLNIEIIGDDPIKTPTLAFAQLLYTGDYAIVDKKIQFKVNEKIEVSTDASEDDIDAAVAIDSEYAKYFKASYASKTVTVQALEQIPDDVLKTKNFIALELTIKTKDSSVSSSAVLNIGISSDTPIETPTLTFAQLLYTGDYAIVDKKIQFKVNEKIEVTTDASEDEIDAAVAIDSEYAKYFKASYASKTVTVQTLDQLPDAVLKTKAFIALELTIKTKDSSVSSSAILNIGISSDTPIETPTLTFAQLLYTGDYAVVDKKIQFKVNEKIEVTTDVSEDDIDAVVAIDSEYAKYFKAAYASKTVTVQALDQIPDDVLKAKAFIALELTIKTKDSSVSSSAILNIGIKSSPDVDTKSIAFSQLLYNGKYDLTGSTPSITYDDISLITDETDEKIKVEIANGFEKYFSVELTDKKVVVTILSPIPTDTLETLTTIAITLTAQIVDTSKRSSAVLNLKVVTDDKSGSIQFAEVLHSGEYSVVDGKGKLTVDGPIRLITDAADSEIETTISYPPEYSSYFTLSYSGQEISVEVKANLPNDLLKDNSFIFLTLSAKIKDSSKSSSSVLNIKLSSDTPIETPTLTFAQLLYTGDYAIVDKKIQFKVNEKIEVTTDVSEDDIDAVVAINSEYAKYFKATYASKTVTVQALDQIPDDVLKAKAFIALELTIKTKDSSVSSSAILNIGIKSSPDVNTKSIAFSQLLYSGKYDLTGSTPSITYDDISLITDETDEKIKVEIANGFEKYFSAELTDKKVVVTVLNPIPTDTLETLTTIAITLTAQIVDTSKRSSAVLNLRVVTDDKSGSIQFAEVLHSGEYSVVDGKGKLTVDGPIRLITDAADSEIEITISYPPEYSSYFTLSYSGQEISVEVKANLPEDVLKDNSFISLTLTAKIKDSTKISSSVLNIKLPSDTPIETPTLAFAQLLYTGDYAIVDKKIQFKVNEKIEVTTDASEDEIDAVVAIDSEYAKYFKATYASKTVTVQALDQIPDDVLKAKAFIALELTIKTKDSSVSSSALLNIGIKSSPDVDTKSIAFSQLLYNGNYDLTGSTPSITYDTISLITDEIDKNIKVGISNGFEKYFSVELTDKKVVVKVLSPIPTDTLETLTTIAITLTAQIVDTSKSSSAVLNLKIFTDNKDKSGSILFAEPLHIGEYSVNDGKGKLTIDDPIQLITDAVDSEIEISISYPSGYSSYFTLSYSGQEISVMVKANLPDDVLKDNSFISLTLTAKIKDSTKSASTVLNIKLPSDTPIETPTLAFNQLLYTGDYAIVDKKIQFKVNEKIEVSTDASEDDIDAVVAINSDFAKYFKATYASKTVTVQTLEQIPDDVLKTKAFIALELTIKTKDSSVSASAVLNIEISSSPDVDTKSIAFSQLLYNGNYDLTGSTPSITYDTISLITDEIDENIKVGISNGFEKYFSVKQTDKKVVVTVLNPIPTDTLETLTTIAITLTAQIVDTSKSSSAVLNLKIVSDNKDKSGSILFAEPLHIGEYSVNDGKGKLTIDDPIRLITDAVDSEIEMSISYPSGYSSYFTLSYSGQEISVMVKANLPDDVLKDNSFISLTLTAKIKDSTKSASTVLNIRLPSDTPIETPTLAFNQLLYTGDYAIVDKKIQFKVNEKIEVSTDASEDDIDAVVAINSEFAKYFKATYASKTVTVQTLEQIPDDVLKTKAFIALELTIKTKDSSVSASAVLNIEISSSPDVAFSQLLYNGNYDLTGSTPSITYDTISIITDEIDENIKVGISNGFEKYFSVKQTDKKVVVTVISPIPTDTLKTLTTIAITLTAQIVDTSKSSSAVLNLKIVTDNKDKSGSILFAEPLHIGEYSVNDGKGKLTIDDPIRLITDAVDSEIEISISYPSGYSSYFTLSYSGQEISVMVKANLPDDVLKDNSFISLTLTAKIKDSTKSASTVLNIKLPSDTPIETPTLAFNQLLYTGDYAIVDKKIQFKVNEKIEVSTDASEDDIDAVVAINSEFAKYFKATYASKTVTVQALDQIPDDVLKAKAFIALELTIKTKDSSVSASAVLNIEINSEPDINTTSIAFSEVLYTGTYDVTGTSAAIKYDAISLVTDQADENIQVEISNGFKKYFSVKLTDKSVNVALTSPIPIDTIQGLTTVAITLTAQIVGTSESSSAVLNLKITSDGDDKEGSILFPEVLHTGTYSVVDGKGILDIDGPIQVITDRAATEIVTSISGPSVYGIYFIATYSSQEIVVAMNANLPDDVFNDNSVISLTITVRIKSSAKTSSSVLNIKLNNGKDDIIKVSFSNFIYNGEYQVKDDKASLRHDPIIIETDQDDDSVDVYIENEYAKYFFIHYSDKLVTITLKNEAPSDTLQKLTNLPVELMVQIKGTQHSAFAVLNLKVIGEDGGDTGVIAFEKVLYNGKYNVSDEEDEPKFTVDEIKVITENLGIDIEVTAWDDYNYNQYFNFSYSTNKVVVSLIKQLPANVYKNVYFIPITLTAKVKSSEKAASTVLNIEIDYSQHNDDLGGSSVNTTGYIAAIVVLALVVLGLLGGAGAFYYFRIRNRRYASMDDEDFGRIKFDKQDRPSSKSLRSTSIEERRPTGYNFNPIFDGNLPKVETPPENNQRRKSVAFNENVQKLEIDAPNDEAFDNKGQITSL